MAATGKRPGGERFEERRAELAAAALKTLAELGYARTSLREIASHSAFSHGVLHYYFADKFELIMFCVRQYKAECVKRYDEALASAESAEMLATRFAAAMTRTLREDTVMHRLWYDLRTLSLFEPGFRPDVTEIDGSLERMIWRVVTEYARLSGGALAVESPLAYALFDGIFEQALRGQVGGDKRAGAKLTAHVLRTLPTMVASSGVP